MATYSTWTVIFDDKKIIKKTGDMASTPKGYEINDDSFWNDSKWSNIWAIQYKADNHDYNDTVEYRDGTPHATWTDANLGDFSSQFITRWDAAHLTFLQEDWDNSTATDAEGTPETPEQKINRLGARPTSYSS